MTTNIRLKRGTKASIDSLAQRGELLEGEPLFVTDEDRLAVATASNAWTYCSMKSDIGQYASKMGQTSYVSTHKFRYNRGIGEGDSLDWSSSTDGITVLKSGLYVVRAVARANGTGDAYIALAVNGDRSILENRTEGSWNHSHATTNNAFTESNYIGRLYQGEFITAGPPTNMTTILYGTNNYVGTLNIYRIG